MPAAPLVQASTARTPSPPQPVRKVINCIIDDTALIAGAKKSTRDGLRKWVAHGAVRLFVPLYTLGQLDRFKKGSGRIHADARETVEWLDQVTSLPGVQRAGLVQLEGVNEAYASWPQVESFVLPATLSVDDDESSPSEDLEASFHTVQVSDETSLSSQPSLDFEPKTPQSPRFDAGAGPPLANGKASPTLPATTPGLLRPTRLSAKKGNGNPAKATIPRYLRPLFSHILWRIHQEANADMALESFVFLTHDPAKHAIAQRFGIHAQRLEQLRSVVGREERELKNRLVVMKLEEKASQTAERAASSGAGAAAPAEGNVALPNGRNDDSDVGSEDEDIIVFRGIRRRSPSPATNGQGVLDPNEFRRPAPASQAKPSAPRGRGRGRGGRGRGNRFGRGPLPEPSAPATPVDLATPIDPDSYERPPLTGATGRGGRRRLWEPK